MADAVLDMIDFWTASIVKFRGLVEGNVTASELNRGFRLTLGDDDRIRFLEHSQPIPVRSLSSSAGLGLLAAALEHKVKLAQDAKDDEDFENKLRTSSFPLKTAANSELPFLIFFAHSRLCADRGYLISES